MLAAGRGSYTTNKWSKANKWSDKSGGRTDKGTSKQTRSVVASFVNYKQKKCNLSQNISFGGGGSGRGGDDYDYDD